MAESANVQRGDSAGFKLLPNASGSSLTTFKIGSESLTVYEVTSRKGLGECLTFLNREEVDPDSIVILGRGSNMLLTSGAVNKKFIKLSGEFAEVREVGEGIFFAGAAVAMPSLSSKMSVAGWAGLEFAAGIPGSIGGAVRMNAGAHGAEISSIIESVEVYSPETGDFITIPAEELQFAYRTCSIEKNVIVSGCTLKMRKPATLDEVESKRKECLEYRKRTQPLTVPSAGSIFRNPGEGLFAAALIEEAGLKGFTAGGAMVSNMHANWIVNPERLATAEDVVTLIALCQAKVAQSKGIRLKAELVIV